jgi:hypothetical protein
VTLDVQDARAAQCACIYRRIAFERDLPQINPTDHAWVRAQIAALNRIVEIIEQQCTSRR